jgi:peptidoglycan-associated lipoprotein
MPRLSRLSVPLSLAGLLLLVGVSCSHPKPVVAPTPAETAAVAAPCWTPAPAATEVSPEPTMSTAEAPEAEIASSALAADLAELNKAGYVKDVFFDTDKAELKPAARDTLADDAAWLKAHPSVKISVEGHCDERNTEDYNLALGWRRANAAKSYLVALGVAADRIGTISYGEERPFSTCHDESCWWQNRRAHLVITAK